jgi:hypothetical protein
MQNAARHHRRDIFGDLLSHSQKQRDGIVAFVTVWRRARLHPLAT